jgi:hypothetical protein
MGTLHVMTPGQLRWRRRMYNNSIVALMKHLGLRFFFDFEDGKPLRH